MLRISPHKRIATAPRHLATISPDHFATIAIMWQGFAPTAHYPGPHCRATISQYVPYPALRLRPGQHASSSTYQFAFSLSGSLGLRPDLAWSLELVGLRPDLAWSPQLVGLRPDQLRREFV